jgi:hypothetical protein
MVFNMKKIVILLSIIMLIPSLMVILNYQVWGELLNGAFNSFSIPTKGSHLSLGTWVTLAYLILLPILQFICFGLFKFNFGLSSKDKILICFITIVSSIGSLYMFTEGIVLLT